MKLAAYSLLSEKIKEYGATDSAVITFNYDIALDYALSFNRVPFDSGLHGSVPRGSLRLLKLHGSTNWARDANSKEILPNDLRALLIEISYR